MSDYAERRKKQLSEIPEELVSCKGELGAYYYSFDKTGCDEIDRILSAVAGAGASAHHTDSWTVPGTARGLEADTLSLVDVIQEHADRAAATIKGLRNQSEQTP